MSSFPQENSIITYGLLRHGETVWNREKRVQGHGDSPLTDQGRQQVAEWAAYLADGGWQHILCSDLGRVRQTVEILNAVLKLPVTVDGRLRELSWGEWEGLKVSEVRRKYHDELAVQVAGGWDFRPPGGESRRELRDRAFAALAAARLMLKAEKVLVVCHLGVIKSLVYAVAGRKFLPEEPMLIEKDRMQHLVYQAGSYRLGPLNITAGATEL